MSDHVLTIEKAKLFVRYPEIFRIFWKNWDAITEVEYEALKYLVENSNIIYLPNVKSLSTEKAELLKSYRGYLKIGI
jgi:hypothetical protein